MKAILLGGAGFIGTVLARRLKDSGHEIVIADLKKSETFPENSVIVDVTDEKTVVDVCAGADAIYNLAAEHRDDVRPVQKYYDVNGGGAETTVRAARAHGIRQIIFTSTVAVYGLNAGDPTSGSVETDSPEPFNDYGKSKLEAENIFNGWAKDDSGNALTMIRLVATFGPNNRGNIYTLMDQIARGKFMMVGSGHNKKSIAYVENVAAFLENALTFGPGHHVYNYADKPDLTTKELVGIIRQSMGLKGYGTQIPYIVGLVGGVTFDVAARLTGRNFPISSIRVKKFCANTVVNADKAHGSGFKAPYSLAEGLQGMIAAEFAELSKAA